MSHPALTATQPAPAKVNESTANVSSTEGGRQSTSTSASYEPEVSNSPPQNTRGAITHSSSVASLSAVEATTQNFKNTKSFDNYYEEFNEAMHDVVRSQGDVTKPLEWVAQIAVMIDDPKGCEWLEKTPTCTRLLFTLISSRTETMLMRNILAVLLQASRKGESLPEKKDRVKPRTLESQRRSHGSHVLLPCSAAACTRLQGCHCSDEGVRACLFTAREHAAPQEGDRAPQHKLVLAQPQRGKQRRGERLGGHLGRRLRCGATDALRPEYEGGRRPPGRAAAARDSRAALT